MTTIDYDTAIASIEDTIKKVIASCSDTISALIEADRVAEGVSRALERGVSAGYAIVKSGMESEGSHTVALDPPEINN